MFERQQSGEKGIHVSARAAAGELCSLMRGHESRILSVVRCWNVHVPSQQPIVSERGRSLPNLRAMGPKATSSVLTCRSRSKGCASSQFLTLEVEHRFRLCTKHRCAPRAAA